MAESMRQRTYLKVVVLGDSGVGKTSLVRQYVNKSFSEQYKSTVGVDISVKDIEFEDRPVTMLIWDTAGQERFQSLCPAYFRGSDCCILVYDVNVPESFGALDTWHEEFLKQDSLLKPWTFPFVLIGNKVDIDGIHAEVTETRAKEWCASKGNMPYFETSAKDGDNVDIAFATVAALALENHDRDQGISLQCLQEHDPLGQQRRGCAC